MNESNSKKNLRFILTLLLALAMSFVLVLSAACGETESASESESESESSSSEETATDKQIVANGDFEFYTTSTTSFPYSSSVKWTRSTDKGAAGVSAATSTATSGIIDVSEKAFGALSDTHKPYKTEGETKVYYNPGTPIASDDAATAANEGGTKILMIHNKVSTEGKGTAQYFTNSETITLAPEKTAKISVWVRTDDLTSTYDGDDKEFGAYIKIINTVSTEIEPLLIKSINTEGKWVNYVIYLKPSAFAVTKYKVVLGLGRGDTKNEKELCEGFAFFDNVEYSIVDNYDTVDAEEFKLYDGENKNVFVENEKSTAFVQSEKGKDYEALNYKVTYKMSFEKAETAAAKAGSGAFNDVDPLAKNYKVQEYAGVGYNDVEKTINGDVKVPANSIYMNFDGKIGSSYTYTYPVIIPHGTYCKMSVTAKVSAKNYSTNASIVLVDGEKDRESGNFTSFTTSGDEVRYTFYLKNTTESDINDSIKFSFGPTELTTSSNRLDLPVGYAIFSDLKVVELTKEEYETADVSTDTHAKKVSVKGDLNNDPEEDEEEENDPYADIKEDYTFTVGNGDYARLENAPIALKDESSTKDYRVEGDGKVGIINSKFADNYGIAGLKDVLDALAEKADTKYVQPILVNNETATSTGIIGKKITVPANTAYQFTVKVKAAGGAKANIYLIDASNPTIGEFDNNNTATVTYNVLNYKPAGNTADAIDRTIAAEIDDYGVVTFYVVTGDEAMSFRLELYNGTRDGSENSQGYVLFDDVYAGTTTYTTYEILKQQYSKNFFTTELKYNQGKIYSYYNGNTDDPVKDDDGNAVYTAAEDYIAYAEGENVKFMRYDVVSKINSVEKETEEEESESESEEEESAESESTIGNLVWLQITSIVIAAALVIALVAVILRKVFEKKTKKKAKTRSYYIGYDKNSHKVPTKHDIEAPEETDEEYNYDN